MAHFGILSLPLTGHLNPILSLAYELKQRGHRITVFGILDIEDKVRQFGDFNFSPIGQHKYPAGTQKNLIKSQGKLIGLAGIINIFKLCQEIAELHLDEAIAAIKTSNIDILIIDQSLIEGETLASLSKLPFITVCSCIVLYPDSKLPNVFTSSEYKQSWLSRLRNRIISSYFVFAAIPVIRTIKRFRQQHNLKNYSDPPNSVWSRLAVICQQTHDFDFPRTLPSQYCYVGPLVSQKARPEIDFLWEKLNQKPLIYASLGTLQNQIIPLYKTIADACSTLDVQLVLSLGGSFSPQELGDLPGSPIVVEYAPQLKLLEKAALCITHAGLNTSMECLMNAVPMVAIPITNDQPGVSARIKWTGTGEFITLKKLNAKRLKTVIDRVLNVPSYRENALRLQKSIKSAGGVNQAASIIEQVVATRKPFVSNTDLID
jgi:zeaxanthin glucosyltransferase